VLIAYFRKDKFIGDRHQGAGLPSHAADAVKAVVEGR
jgi:hypothetical protein